MRLKVNPGIEFLPEEEEWARGYALLFCKFMT